MRRSGCSKVAAGWVTVRSITQRSVGSRSGGGSGRGGGINDPDPFALADDR